VHRTVSTATQLGQLVSLHCAALATFTRVCSCWCAAHTRIVKHEAIKCIANALVCCFCGFLRFALQAARQG
jgi:hypothetical protein